MSDRPLAFITGASSGIGAAAVPIFAEAGYNVVFSARRKDRLVALAETFGKAFPQATLLPLVCDVTDTVSVQSAFETVRERFGKLNVLVNNAGYGIYGSFEKTDLDAVKANFETNVFGMIRCTQAALPLLRAATTRSPKRWPAAIVMVSSFVGRRAIPNISSYSATKFAMEGFSEALRVELFDERIAVSVVNPGATSTDFFDSAEGQRPNGFATPRMTAPDVARHILKAARRPRRNIYLTTQGQAGIFAQWLSPALMDHALLRKVWRKI
jgi:short-subunit dehydrogenase